MKPTKIHTETKTGAKYTVDKKLDGIKSVKTTSNKSEEVKKYKFVF